MSLGLQTQRVRTGRLRPSIKEPTVRRKTKPTIIKCVCSKRHRPKSSGPRSLEPTDPFGGLRKGRL